MKSIKLLIVLFCLFTLATMPKAQAQTTTGPTINAITTAVPVFQQELSLTDGSQTRVDVPAVDATIVVNPRNAAIEEIEVITGAYDAKYHAQISRTVQRTADGQLTQFTVNGHPDGSYIVVFKDSPDATQTEGRQKNRRVEMKIIFN